MTTYLDLKGQGPQGNQVTIEMWQKWKLRAEWWLKMPISEFIVILENQCRGQDDGSNSKESKFDTAVNQFKRNKLSLQTIKTPADYRKIVDQYMVAVTIIIDRFNLDDNSDSDDSIKPLSLKYLSRKS